MISNGIREGVAMMLLKYLVNTTTKAAQTAMVTTKEDRRNQQSRKLTPYPEIVNYLLITYATGEVITEADAEIKLLRQPSIILPSEFV